MVSDPASPNGRYSALLVDYGGVLTSSPFLSFESFCQTEGLEPSAVMGGFREDACRQLIIGLETGALTEEAFEPRFAEILGVDSPRLIDRLFAGYRPDEAMQEAVLRARRAGIRTGLISNSWGTRRYDRGRLGELFDGVVISGEVGLRKPSGEIYELGAEQVGAPAHECVFVDDLAWNLEPAAELGMATVHHTDAQQTIPELERLLGIALR